MKLKAFQKPSRELAERILSELEFKDRFQCYRLHQRAGFVPITCYSFEEILYYFLKEPLQININKLMAWVSDAIGDAELSERIGELDNAGISEEEKLIQIKSLMLIRLSQAKATKA